MSNIYGKVSTIGADRKNPNHMNIIGTEVLAYINATKIAKGKSTAIVEFTVIQSISEGYDKNGNSVGYKKGDYLMHMQREGYTGQMLKMMRKYTAAAEGVDPNHQFDADEDTNDDLWDAANVRVFGKPELVGGDMLFVNDNVMKGSVGRWKVVADNQTGRKKKNLDDAGNVIIYPELVFCGLVGPDEIDPDVLVAERANIHAQYYSA